MRNTPLKRIPLLAVLLLFAGILYGRPVASVRTDVRRPERRQYNIGARYPEDIKYEKMS